jgi:hypothetical protein
VLLKGSIAVCVLVASVTLGATIDAGARAKPALDQALEPRILENGEDNFGNGTWAVSSIGAEFDKPDPGGWAAQYTWSIPETIPPGGVHAKLTVEVVGREAGRTAVAQLKSFDGIAISGDEPHEVTATAGPRGEASAEASFQLIPKGNAGIVDVVIPDGPVISFYYAAGDTQTLPTPAPGETATASGRLEKGSSDATVTVQSSDESLAKMAVVGEGSTAERRGQRTAACWLLGPDAVVPNGHSLKNVLKDPRAVKIWKDAEQNPLKYLALCKVLVRQLFADAGEIEARNPSRASGCARQIVISGKKTLKPAKPKDLPKTAVKYRCADTGHGGAEITAKSSNKKGLRGELGKTLDLGVVRSPDAPASDATLTFGFSS